MQAFDLSPHDPLLLELMDIVLPVQVETHNPIYVKKEYQDDKIKIIAILANDVKRFEKIYVLIKQSDPAMPNTRASKPLGFSPDGLTTTENQTFVCEFELGTNRETYNQTWYRPGRWVNYVHKLAEEREKNRKIAIKLNRQPVDDNDLFEDI